MGSDENPRVLAVYPASASAGEVSNPTVTAKENPWSARGFLLPRMACGASVVQISSAALLISPAGTERDPAVGDVVDRGGCLGEVQRVQRDIFADPARVTGKEGVVPQNFMTISMTRDNPGLHSLVPVSRCAFPQIGVTGVRIGSMLSPSPRSVGKPS